MTMALALIIIVVLWLCWGHIKPSVANIGKAAEQSSEALVKGAIRLNLEAGKDLSDDIFNELARQREFLKKL